MRCLAVALLLIAGAHASVIGFDFGVDWFKVSIVKKGIPLETVLNVESKRKTASAITMHKGERIFGEPVKRPTQAYPSLKNLLGVLFSSQRAIKYRDTYDNNMDVPEKNGGREDVISFTVQGESFRVQHLVAMIMAHGKKQAEAYGQEPVFGAVLTVPPFFNQFERQALVDSAELAGLKVISLMNDETAVALNYAMTRKFTNTTQHHIFFDMGAGSTVVSLIAFKNAPVTKPGSKSKKTAPLIEVLATGFDDSLGGKDMDHLMYSMLAERLYESQPDVTPDALSADHVASARLLKAANKAKLVLSANKETGSSIESFFSENRDFRTKVTRSELEDKIKESGMIPRFTAPIKAVLEDSSLTLDEIDSLVLVGGGVRVPIVQKALEDFLGSKHKHKIARNVNGDEAAVLGAGFRAAAYSAGFRVKEIMIKDRNLSPIEVWYEAESGDDRVLKTLIFGGNTLLGAKKLFTFKRTSDFTFSLVYRKSETPIFTVSLEGVEDAHKKLTDNGKQINKGPAVKVVLKLDDSGLVSVGDAYVWAEVTKKKPSFLGGIFGSSETKEGAVDDADAVDEEVAENNSTETEAKKDPKAEEKASVEKFPLKVTVKPQTVLPLTEEEKMEIRSRIDAMDVRDNEKMAQEEALNNFESLIYAIKYGLEEEDVMAVTTESDRTDLMGKVVAGQEWFEDEGYKAKTADIILQHQILDVVWSPVILRKKEAVDRPLATKALQDQLTATRELVAETMANQTKLEKSEVKVYQEVLPAQLTLITDHLDEVDKWLTEKLKEQDGKQAHETPAFISSECRSRVSEIKDAYTKFLRARKWKYVTTESNSSSGSVVGETPSASSEEETTTSTTSVDADETPETKIEDELPAEDAAPGDEAETSKDTEKDPEDL